MLAISTEDKKWNNNYNIYVYISYGILLTFLLFSYYNSNVMMTENMFSIMNTKEIFLLKTEK